MVRKKALVLCGGGAKGAYELGVYKAIREMDYKFDIIVGTSIGGLNGGLLAQGDYDVLDDLWHTMDADKVMNDAIDFDFNISTLYNEKGKIKKFLNDYKENKGADTTPLRNRIRELAKPERIKANGIVFGCVVVKYPQMIPVEITLDEMGEDLYADYLIATSSCFPAFPTHVINGQEYVDGGYYDNCPIHFAYKLGAQDIIAVDLNYPKVTHPEFLSQPNITYIVPSRDTGNFLYFDQDHFKDLERMGYLDASKVFGKYTGHKYTFNHESKKLIDDLINNFTDKMHHVDLELTKDGKFGPLPAKPKSRLVDMFNDTYPYKNDNQDFVITILEEAAEIAELDKNKIYSIRGLVKELIENYSPDENDCVSQLLNSPSLLSLNAIKQASEIVTNLHTKDLLRYLISYFQNSFEAVNPNLVTIAKAAPKTFTTAFFLFTAIDLFNKE